MEKVDKSKSADSLALKLGCFKKMSAGFGVCPPPTSYGPEIPMHKGNCCVQWILDGVQDTPIMKGGKKPPKFKSAIWCLTTIKLGRNRV